MSLESIVRPFQTPDNSPNKPFFTAGKAAPQNIILQFGRAGGGRVLNGSSSYTASFYMTVYVNEKRQVAF
jgi:hypothetical protein